MENSKLIQIFIRLDKREKALLKKWVHSPMHNSHKEVTKLFDYLLSRRKITAQNITKEKIFAHISANKPYDDLRLRHVVSWAVQVLEQFVCFLMQQKESKQFNLFRFYNKKQLKKYANQTSKKLTQAFETEKVRDQVYYDQLYAFKKECSNQYFREHTTLDAQNLKGTLDSFSINFIIETLKHACNVLNAKDLKKGTIQQISFLPTILDLLQNDDSYYNNVVTIRCYYNCYMLQKHLTDFSYYHKLKTDLFAHYESISPTNLKQLYILTLNSRIKLHNITQDDQEYDILDLYEFGLKHRILMYNNVLRRISYQNIIAAAAELKRPKWLQNFVTTYTSFLDVPYQKNYGLLAQGRIAQLQGNYKESLQLFAQIDTDDFYLILLVKALSVSAYYLSDELDALDTFLSNFYQYLQRNPIPNYHHQYYMNYLSVMRKLINLAPYDYKNIQKLKQQVKEEQLLLGKKWILEQLDKLL